MNKRSDTLEMSITFRETSFDRKKEKSKDYCIILNIKNLYLAQALNVTLCKCSLKKNIN